MKRPKFVAGMPKLSLRLKMTLVVGFAAGSVLIFAAVFGLRWIEQALVDDVLDEQVALQSELAVPLLTLMRQNPITSSDFTEFAQSSGSGSAGESVDMPEVITASGFDSDQATLMTPQAQRVNEALAFLDSLGLIGPLVTAQGSNTAVNVVLSNGVVVAFPIDQRAELMVLDARALQTPVITEFALTDLVFRLGGYAPLQMPLAPSNQNGVAMPPNAAQIKFAARNIGGTDFVVAADITNITRSINRISSILWVVVPIAIAGQAFIASLLVGRALRSVNRITKQVQKIDSGTLDQRVPVPGTRDEIDELANTMNTMLGHLHQSDTRLRQFVSDASHELRTPVAVLQSEAEVALSNPTGTSVDDLATGVLSETERLRRIVDDLLVLARHDEQRSIVSTIAVDLDDIVLAEAARCRGVEVDISGVSAGKVLATPEQLTRIVAHLLDNAARYGNTSVCLKLTTDQDHRTILTIDDDGPGIASVDRARIFERFTRLSEARSRDSGGAGLGLAVVKALLDELGGQIVVSDSPLGGARFEVSFPCNDV